MGSEKCGEKEERHLFLSSVPPEVDCCGPLQPLPQVLPPGLSISNPRFLSPSPSPCLSCSAALSAFRSLPPRVLTQTNRGPRTRAAGAFRHLDKDRSGTIGVTEFLSLCDIFFLDFEDLDDLKMELQRSEPADRFPRLRKAMSSWYVLRSRVPPSPVPPKVFVQASMLPLPFKPGRSFEVVHFALLCLNFIIVVIAALEGRSLWDPSWISILDSALLCVLVFFSLLPSCRPKFAPLISTPPVFFFRPCCALADCRLLFVVEIVLCIVADGGWVLFWKKDNWNKFCVPLVLPLSVCALFSFYIM